MVDAVEARMMFKSAFINHYRTERERSESCIGDIIDILQTKDTSAEEQTVEILERIIRHYSRS